MADRQIGVVSANFPNSLKADPDSKIDELGITNPVKYTSIKELRQALSTARPDYYDKKMLDSMTVNDMVFALRNIEDPKTIADYM